MSYPLELAVTEVDRKSVDFLSCSATASSKVGVVDVLVSAAVIVRKQLTALEVVATPSQILDTPVPVYHDMSEGMIVVLTTSLEYCQRLSDVVALIHPPLWEVTQNSLEPVQAMYISVAGFSKWPESVKSQET